MTTTLNAYTDPGLQRVLINLASDLEMDFTLPLSEAFKVTLESRDGLNLRVSVNPEGAGASQRPVMVDGSKLSKVNGVSGTLVAGTATLSLASATTDVLAVQRTTSGGTAGVLSVVRATASTVTVTSWLAGTGVQVLDTSTVVVYNLGPRK